MLASPILSPWGRRAPEQEARGRVRRHRQEHRDEVVLARALADLASDPVRNERDRPHALPRVLDEAGALEGGAGLAEERLGDLLQAVVDRPDDRGALEDALAEIEDRAADEVLRQRADDGGERQKQQQPEPEDVAPEDILRVVGVRDQRDHLGVDEVDRPVEQVAGQKQRQDDDEAGEEIVPQPLHQRRAQRAAATFAGHRVSGAGCRAELRTGG